MDDKFDLKRHLEAAVERHGQATAQAILSRFMCRFLLQVEHLLPPVGVAALRTAKSHWMDGLDRSAELVAARARCSQYLDSVSRLGITEDEAPVRALMCVLYPTPEDEAAQAEGLRWFSEVMQRAGPAGNDPGDAMDEVPPSP